MCSTMKKKRLRTLPGSAYSGPEGQAVAAISIVGTTVQAHEGNIDQLARRAIATTNKITQHVFGSEATQNASLAGLWNLPARIPRRWPVS
jgi:hypothetical protein